MLEPGGAKLAPGEGAMGDSTKSYGRPPRNCESELARDQIAINWSHRRTKHRPLSDAPPLSRDAPSPAQSPLRAEQSALPVHPASRVLGLHQPTGRRHHLGGGERRLPFVTTSQGKPLAVNPRERYSPLPRPGCMIATTIETGGAQECLARKLPNPWLRSAWTRPAALRF